MAPSVVGPAAVQHHGAPLFQATTPQSSSTPDASHVGPHSLLSAAVAASSPSHQRNSSCDLWTSIPPRTSSRDFVPSPPTLGSQYPGSNTPSPLSGAAMNVQSLSPKTYSPDYYRTAATCTFSSLPGMMFPG